MSFAQPESGLRNWSAVRRIGSHSAAILAALFCLAHAASAASAPAPAAGGFASVDVAKVLAGASAQKDAEAKMSAYKDQYQNAFDTLKANVMLDSGDMTQLSKLLVEDAASDADKQTITQLEAKAAADAKALSDLQAKPDAQQTPDDKTKLNTLTQEYEAGQEALQGIQQTYQDDLQQEGQTLSDTVTKAMRAAVAKVAQKQGIAVVFDSQVALYAATDLTDAVAAEMAK